MQTILVPAGSLSSRDREILAGMSRGNYRTYPVRPGESLDDILEKRNITKDEFLALNPEVDAAKLQGAPRSLATQPCVAIAIASKRVFACLSHPSGI